MSEKSNENVNYKQIEIKLCVKKSTTDYTVQKPITDFRDQRNPWCFLILNDINILLYQFYFPNHGKL